MLSSTLFTLEFKSLLQGISSSYICLELLDVPKTCCNHFLSLLLKIRKWGELLKHGDLAKHFSVYFSVGFPQKPQEESGGSDSRKGSLTLN